MSRVTKGEKEKNNACEHASAVIKVSRRKEKREKYMERRLSVKEKKLKTEAA